MVYIMILPALILLTGIWVVSGCQVLAIGWNRRIISRNQEGQDYGWKSKERES